MSDARTPVDHYGAQYGNFASELLAQIRADTFGEDIGQNGWLAACALREPDRGDASGELGVSRTEKAPR